MPFIPYIPDDRIPPDEWVPDKDNVLRVHGIHARVMRLHYDLYVELMRGASPLSRAQREMIAVAVSAANRCDYCVAHHGENLRRILVHDGRGQSEAVAFVEALSADYRGAELAPADKAMLDYVVKLTEAPGKVAQSDVDRLRASGFDDRAIHDICLVAAYYGFVSRVAEGLGVDLEERFRRAEPKAPEPSAGAERGPGIGPSGAPGGTADTGATEGGGEEAEGGAAAGPGAKPTDAWGLQDQRLMAVAPVAPAPSVPRASDELTLPPLPPILPSEPEPAPVPPPPEPAAVEPLAIEATAPPPWMPPPPEPVIPAPVATEPVGSAPAAHVSEPAAGPAGVEAPPRPSLAPAPSFTLSGALRRPSAAPARLAFRHHWIVRLTHWVNTVLLVGMVASGLQIYNAYERFGLRGTRLAAPNPFDMHPFPHWMRLGGWLAGGLNWHFFLMWPLVLNALLYLAYLAWSREWRSLIFRPRDVGPAIQMQLDSLRVIREHPPQGKHNPLQKAAYCFIFLLGILSVLTGLALWKPVQLAWLTEFFGGYEWARYWHFVAVWVFVAFTLVHVVLVFAVDPPSLKAMITGWYRGRFPSHDT